MIAMEAFWFVALAAYPLLVGWGWVVVARGDYTGARICFWSGTVWLGGATILLGMGSDWPAAQRVVVVGTLGAFLFIGLTEGLRWIEHEAKAQMTAQQTLQPAPPINAPDNKPSVGSDTTIVGTVPAGGVGDRSTIVNDADSRGNVIHNRTEAIGTRACASPGTVAIGSGANAGACDARAGR